MPDTVQPEPPPAGVAHVPSPRQKVVPEAAVPELRFVTGRFPVTPVVSGKPVALAKVSVGAVANTRLPVPVAPAEVTPSSVTCPVIAAVPGIVMPVAVPVRNVVWVCAPVPLATANGACRNILAAAAFPVPFPVVIVALAPAIFVPLPLSPTCRVLARGEAPALLPMRNVPLLGKTYNSPLLSLINEEFQTNDPALPKLI